MSEKVILAPDALVPSVAERRQSRLLSRVRMASLHVVVFVALLGIWQALVVTGVLPTLVVPAPADILLEFGSMVRNLATGGFMLGHLVVTLQEVALGFLGAVVIGVTLGGLISEIKWLRILAMPYMVGFNATPKIAFAPVFLIWFGFGIWSKVAMGIAIATFPILIGTIAGLNATDRHQERLLRVYGATPWQAFRKVRLYVALPFIFAGFEIAIVLAIIGALVGEFTGGGEGLGYILLVAQVALNLPQAFAVIILLSIIGIVLHQLVVFAQRRILFWHSGAKVSIAETA